MHNLHSAQCDCLKRPCCFRLKLIKTVCIYDRSTSWVKSIGASSLSKPNCQHALQWSGCFHWDREPAQFPRVADVSCDRCLSLRRHCCMSPLSVTAVCHWAVTAVCHRCLPLRRHRCLSPLSVTAPSLLSVTAPSPLFVTAGERPPMTRHSDNFRPGRSVRKSPE